jgi:hypothetical protein
VSVWLPAGLTILALLNKYVEAKLSENKSHFNMKVLNGMMAPTPWQPSTRLKTLDSKETSTSGKYDATTIV